MDWLSFAFLAALSRPDTVIFSVADLTGTVDSLIRFPKARWLQSVFVYCFVAWPIRHYGLTVNEAAIRTPQDRVQAGKALSGLKVSMYVIENGALPYFSGWRAADDWGLDDEFIARNGTTPT